MKNKAALTMIELVLMLSVFAAAAALCMGALMWAGETSERCSDRDQALLQAQNAAQVLKSCGGDLDKAAELFGGANTPEGWIVHYNGDWEQAEENGKYVLVVRHGESGSDLLGLANIRVLCGESCLVEIKAAWQEVKMGES